MPRPNDKDLINKALDLIRTEQKRDDPRAVCPTPSRFWQVEMGVLAWTLGEAGHLSGCADCRAYQATVADAVAEYRAALIPGWWTLTGRLWDAAMELVHEADRALSVPKMGVISSFSGPGEAVRVTPTRAPEQELRFPGDPDLQAVLYREAKDGDARWLSLSHCRLQPGTLLQIRIRGAGPQGLGRWVVLRKGFTQAAAQARVEEALTRFEEGRLQIGRAPAASALRPEDAVGLRESYRLARQEDRVAVQPVDGPRSAWQLWADAAVREADVCSEVHQVAEAIARG